MRDSVHHARSRAGSDESNTSMSRVTPSGTHATSVPSASFAGNAPPSPPPTPSLSAQAIRTRSAGLPTRANPYRPTRLSLSSRP